MTQHFLSKLVKPFHYCLRLLVAVPLLLVITIAAPASTSEANPIESEEVEEDEQIPKTLTPPIFNWGSYGGEPPSDTDMTPGLSNPKATGAFLMNAVRNVHARKMDEKLSFGQTMGELAKELRGEIPPQFEDKGIEEANEGIPEDPDTETDRPRRHIRPRIKGRLPK